MKEIAVAIAEISQPGMKPKDLFKAVQERYPKAGKNEIRSAAFYSLILAAEADPDKVSELHEMALRARGNDEEENHN